jgi:hypothetical protein
MAAYEDFNFFQVSTLRAPFAKRRGETSADPETPSPSRDALRAELERIHLELRTMRKTLERQRRWRERLRRLMGYVVPRASPSRRARDSA